jgi:cytochrome c oxidase subunit 2
MPSDDRAGRRGAQSAGFEWKWNRLLTAVLLLALAGLVFTAQAGADAITPEAGPSKNATDTDTLYKIVFFTGLAVIALVWGLLFYSLVRFRARRGRVAPPVRGNTILELGWTAGAVALILAIAVVMLVMLDDIKNPVRTGPFARADSSAENAALNQPPPPGDRALDIKVGGQQYFWRYQYPNGAVSFHDMVVPRDTTVTLDISSNDVNHSWWIPKLGGKADAIRGYTNHAWFKATKTGVFGGQCAEFCGANHAFMSARVIVVEPSRYERWVSDQKRLIQEAQKAVQVQRKKLLPAVSGASGG